MGSFLGILRFALLAGIFVVYITRVRGGEDPEACPRSRQKAQKWPVLLIALFVAQDVVSAWGRRGADVWTALLILQYGVLFLVGLYYFSRPLREADARENYRSEPDLCGRCDFNLTGNTTGVCPECGWVLNPEPLPTDSPDWDCWWREWQITSLVDWRQTLRTLAITSAFLSSMGLEMGLVFGRWILLIVSGAMSLHLLINLVRVVQYGRRQVQSSLPPSLASTTDQSTLLMPEDCRE